MDGKAMRPDGKPAATMMPSAFGLAGVNHHTWTGGWGTVTYWNAYVANTQMHGKGTFSIRSGQREAIPGGRQGQVGPEARRRRSDHREAAGPALLSTGHARAQPPEARSTPTGVARRAALQRAQGRPTAPVPRTAAVHRAGAQLHTAAEIGIDDFQANRGPARSYVTTPLRALFDTQKIHKGGFYHDGRFATLAGREPLRWSLQAEPDGRSERDLNPVL